MMKRKSWIATTVLASGLIATGASAQLFDSGSNGTYGPIVCTTGTVTLDLPADGVFHATTVTVDAGCTLNFNRNALNTPVHILATGDIIVAGTIDVNGGDAPPTLLAGLGGPGGFDGGTGGFGVNFLPGTGQGPGGGFGGVNGFGANSAGLGVYALRSGTSGSSTNGQVYGSSLLVPMVGGSGGGGAEGFPGKGGGGGGGGILLASSSLVQVSAGGSIQARGGVGVQANTWHYGAGSGGAIRLVAAIVAGSGTLDVTASPSLVNIGRIRIDTMNLTQMSLSTPSVTASFGINMVGIPATQPRLDIIEAAGQIIAEGATDPVSILLPLDGDPNRTVTVQGRDFTGLVPITVALTSEVGDRVTYDADIDMSLGNPATVVVNVVLPTNTPTHIEVWTR